MSCEEPSRIVPTACHFLSWIILWLFITDQLSELSILKKWIILDCKVFIFHTVFLTLIHNILINICDGWIGYCIYTIIKGTKTLECSFVFDKQFSFLPTEHELMKPTVTLEMGSSMNWPVGTINFPMKKQFTSWVDLVRIYDN